ncbi:MAG: hypothetical protein NWE99_10925 [Candidatus Bathyarchaeota archaeon]|nr:hypothetical protein [Candidatus Bathyarchaeota archaeon]
METAISAVISLILALLSIAFGTKYQQGKAKAQQLSQLLKLIVDAAEDDKVSEDEFQKIVAAAKKLMEA